MFYKQRATTGLDPWSRLWDYLSQPEVARLLLLSFWIGSASLIFLGVGKPLNYLFPACSGFLGIILFRRCPVLYMSFVLWLWFLSPLIRRLVDNQAGFMDPSPILLAPYSATLACFFWFITRIHKHNSDGLPFLLSSISVFYGFVVGALNEATLTKLVVGGLDYLAPILFGFFVFSYWREHHLYRKRFARTILYSSLLCGSYGIFQYFTAPSWDCFWLIGTEITSMGRPAPFELRIWSTMHSPGVFSQVLSSSLIFLSVTASGIVAIPANTVGYISLLLSLVRSAWVGLLGGFIVLFSTLKYKYQTRLLVVATLACFCIVLLLQEQSFSEILSTRLGSFRDIGEDGSGMVRLSLYRQFLENALFNVVGAGISVKSGFDSGILTLISDLGWIGAVPYFCSLLLLITGCTSEALEQSTFEKACTAAGLTCFFQIGFGPIHIELPGVMMWTFFSMTLAAKKNRLFLARTAHSSPNLLSVS